MLAGSSLSSRRSCSPADLLRAGFTRRGEGDHRLVLRQGGHQGCPSLGLPRRRREVRDTPIG